MPDEFDKDIMQAVNMKKIYSIQYKISRIEATRKHYMNWMECSKTNPNLQFLEYLNQLKASYNEELSYYKKKNSEV